MAARGAVHSASEIELASLARHLKKSLTVLWTLRPNVLFLIVVEAHVASDFIKAFEDALSLQIIMNSGSVE